MSTDDINEEILPRKGEHISELKCTKIFIVRETANFLRSFERMNKIKFNY